MGVRYRGLDVVGSGLVADDDPMDLPPNPWSGKPNLTGPWRWDVAVSYDDNNIRTEHEWWEITKRTETQLDATYRRRVILTSSDGNRSRVRTRRLGRSTTRTCSTASAKKSTGTSTSSPPSQATTRASRGDTEALARAPRPLDPRVARQARQILYRPEDAH